MTDEVHTLMSQTFEQFGKYILLEKLASGGMAEVFLAKSNGANGVSKFVAIKRILPQYFDNTDFIEMFKEEAKIAVNLNHGNVVSIFDFGIEKNQFYLVMEYVEGQNLRQIINELKKRTSTFTIEQVVYMVKEVAAGLDHAHRCIDGSTGKPLNITHRDMSPQNIMVSFEGEVKVIDFGIAKAETQMEATKAGTLKGKFGYMSPEQADGMPIDLRTDVFSLGIVLWELLANDRLFSANNEAAILRKIKDCQIPSIRKINPAVPPELEKIVNKALAKDKSMRYQTAAQMQKDLNRFLNTEYPDFSSQDFSIFVKNTFSKYYTDSKRKLVDYAKVQFVPEEKSVTKSMTFVALDPNIPDPDHQGTGHELPSLGDNPYSEVASETNLIVDLNGLKSEITGSKPFRQTSISNHTISGKSGLKKIPQSRTSSKRKSPLRKGGQEASWILGGIFVLIVGAGSFWFLGKRSPTNTSNSGQINLGSNQPNNETALPPPKISSMETYAVTIHSDPLGAKIFIDGKEQPEPTPYRTQLPANKEFMLRLEKSGYFTHESLVRPNQDGYSVNVSLLIGRSGYLNLSVFNGGADPVVEINGQRIKDKLPLDQYKIPANIPLRIKIYNPFTQLSSEKTVIVKENERLNLQMILTREAQKQ